MIDRIAALLRRPEPGPDDTRRLARRAALQRIVEDCRVQLEAIELVGDDSRPTALVLCRKLYADLNRGFEAIGECPDGAHQPDDAAKVPPPAEPLLRTEQAATLARLGSGGDEDADVVDLRRITAVLGALLRALSSRLGKLERRAVRTTLDDWRRRVRAAAVIGAVAIAAIAAAGLSAHRSQQAEATARFDALYAEGLALTREERHEAAAAIYREAIEALGGVPATAPAFNNLGWSLTSLGRHAEAVTAFETALALSPDFALARNNLQVARRRLAPAAPPKRE